MTSEICSGLWFIAELCFILIAFCTTAVGTSCPGGVGSVKCVISTATAGALRREERHRREDGLDGETWSFITVPTESVGERARKLWAGEGGWKRLLCFRGQRMSVSPRVPLVLPRYLCLRLMVKLAGLLIHFAVTGPWDQPHDLILSSELPGVVAVFLVGAKSCRSQWCHSYSTVRLIPLLCILLI